MTEPTRETERPGSDDKRARLAELLRRRAGRDDSAHPLSHGQQALWFLHQLVPGTAAYNVVFSARVHSPFDVGALARALRGLTTRHPILRAAFEAREGRPVQRLRPVADVTVEEIDARGLAADLLADALVEAAQRPFDVSAEPLVRAALFTRAADDHVLVLTVHHLVVDGWSFGLLLDDLFQLYAHEASGGAPPAAAEPAQYLDFVRWQSELLASAEGTRLRTYWNETLSGELPVLDLPTDRPRPAVVSLRGSSVGFALDEELTTRLKRLAAAEGTTPFVVMLAALQALLSRYTGQTDVLVGSPVAGRGRPAFERIVGNCMNMVALRGDLSDDPPFRSFVGQMRGRVLGALAHQDYPFPLVVKGLAADRDLSRMPVFQVTFNYLRLQTASGVGALIAQGGGSAAVEIGGLRLQSYPLPQQEGQFDLALEMTEVGRGLLGRLKYDTALFDASTAARMVGHFAILLRGAVATPECAISALPLLTERERQILVDWNRTERPYPLQLGLHELIEAQAARTPDRIAVQLDGESLTYQALDARANQLARRLVACGAKPDVLVGVCMERSLELVVALFGVLKAGAAYVPLDPSYPTDRLAFMAEDAAAPVILTQPHLRGVLPPTGAEVVVLEPGWTALAGESTAPIRSGVAGDHLAYTIYTSGSTGRPKGAMNTHRGIVNRLLWMQETYALGADDRVLQKTPFSFDVSVWELFWPLLAGARLVLARPEGHKDSRYLVDLIAGQGITTAHFVPSMLQVFLDEPDVQRCASLRRVIASGEALPVELVERFFARLSAELHNLYGPTEAAVDVTAWACQPGERRRSVPIGRPIANTTIHILDRNGAPVPVGVPGELHIGGVQVARGYLGRPELTVERFVPDAFSATPDARLYRTGDLARYRPDGEIEYLGRLDHQIKLRGFRIELGEIEATLTGHPAVREAIVVAQDDRAAGPRLLAFVVPSSGQTIDLADLQTHLKAALPDYMVPSAVIPLERLPLLPNGKIDRGALPLVDVVWEEPAEEYLAPRTDVERALAAIWADVLKLDRVGVRADFFALGGHSLLATRVMTRIRGDLGVDIPLRRLFEAPTVAALAVDVESAAKAEAVSPAIPPPGPVTRTRPAPASFVQRRMWFFDQVSPGSAAYNIPLILELAGPLAHERLERALAMLVERHAVLRTTLQVLDGDVVQVVGAAPPPVPMLDLSRLTPGEREEAVRRQTTEQARRPFDLAQGPLVRPCLLRLAPDAHLLTVTAHHAVLDGWSIAIFVRELAETYAALTEARPLALPALPIQYADFAEWQRAWLTDGALAPQLAYWRRQLAGAPELLDLPADRPHPPRADLRGLGVHARALGRRGPGPPGAEPARGRHDVHDHPGRVQEPAVPVHRAGGPGRGLADRRPQPAGHRRAARRLHQYAGAADGSLGRSDVPRAAGAGARGDARRLRASGRAVRAAGRGAASRAASRSQSALPGALQPAELRLELRGGRRRRAVCAAAVPGSRRGRREPDPLRVRRGGGAASLAGLRARAVRPRHGGADARALRDPGAGHRGESRPPAVRVAPAARRRAPARARRVECHGGRRAARRDLCASVRGPGGADPGGRRRHRRCGRADLRRARRPGEPPGAPPRRRRRGRRPGGGAARRALARFPDLDPRRVQGRRRLPAARSPSSRRPARRHPDGERRRARPRRRRVRSRAGGRAGRDG